MSPTTRSLKLLRDRGYLPAVVERFNHFAKIRQDLYGFIDLVAIKEGTTGVLGIQTTTGSNLLKRIKKSQQRPELIVWLKAGNRFILHGWRKGGARGKRKTWRVKEIEMVLDGSKPAVINLGNGLEKEKQYQKS